MTKAHDPSRLPADEELASWSPSRVHEALTELLATPGWRYLTLYHANEILRSALALRDPSLTREQVDMTRGAIKAAHDFTSLPAVILNSVQFDAAVKRAKGERDDATGGGE